MMIFFWVALIVLLFVFLRKVIKGRVQIIGEESVKEKRRIMFAAHLTIGHTRALSIVAKELRKMGHEVSFVMMDMEMPFASLMPEHLRTAMEIPRSFRRDGFPVFNVSSTLESMIYGLILPMKTGYKELECAIKFFTSGIDTQAKQISDYAKKWKADIIVADYLMLSGYFGSKLAGIPYISVYHTALPFKVDSAPAFGSGLHSDARKEDLDYAKSCFSKINEVFMERTKRASSKLGIDDQLSFNKPISQDLNILLSKPFLEPSLSDLSEYNVLFSGPCMPLESDSNINDPCLSLVKGLKATFVYVSLGTVFNNQINVFSTIINGITSLFEKYEDLHIIVSAGATYDNLLSKSNERIHIYKRVPQAELLKSIHAVVTHGGNNTVQETLSCGIPMIVIPFGSDQYENAIRVQLLGVGISVRKEELTSEKIRESTEFLLTNEFQTKARAIKEKFANEKNGTISVVESILGIIENNKKP